MSTHIEFDEVCKSCKGTGLYSGMGERDGAAVICHTCEGTGCHHFEYDYKEFKRRSSPPQSVIRVYRVNPGIGIGEGNGHHLADFGGIPIKAWLSGSEFPPGTEDREHTCPAWFYQSADYKKKPDWATCGFGSFSDCDSFKNKEKCWARWDKKFGGDV